MEHTNAAPDTGGDAVDDDRADVDARARDATALAAAVRRFLTALDEDGRSAACQPFDDSARRSWSYFPGDRPGLSLSRMTRDQEKRAFGALAHTLSTSGFAQAATICALEDVLDVVQDRERRSRRDYWVAVFGEPGADRWGWRFEGHHVSVNVTVAGSAVAATPTFLGANPARLGAPVVAPLAEEEDLARALVTGLDDETRSRAVVATSPPPDIRTRFTADVDDDAPARGVTGRELDDAAAARLRRLVEVYLGRLSGPAAARLADGVVLGEVTLAWAGGLRPGEPHYYRLRGPWLLVEYDNTQDGANHIHTVVRDPRDDFGAGLLAAHYRAAH